jgi:hypothetical protein
MCISSGTSWFSLAEPAAFSGPQWGQRYRRWRAQLPCRPNCQIAELASLKCLRGESTGREAICLRKGLWGAVARNFASILVAADAGEPRMA